MRIWRYRKQKLTKLFKQLDKMKTDPHFYINFKVQYGVALYLELAKKYNRLSTMKLLKS